MAKDLAREVGYIYIDSGAMYRAVTLYSIENGIFDGDVIDTERLKKEIKDIQIKPEVIDPDDAEMLQDLIIVAVNEGLRQIDEISNSEMSKLTGGLGIPGL